MLVISPVGKRVYGYASARSEDAFNLDVARIHQADEVFHNDVHAVLVKVAVVAETEQVELEALALDHPFIGDIRYDYPGEVGLPGLGAERCKFRTIERDEIVGAGVLVDKSLQHFGRVLIGVSDVCVTEQCDTVEFVIGTHINDDTEGQLSCPSASYMLMVVSQ